MNTGRPSSKPPLPGRGWFGWLGRQFGYVSRAIKTDVGGPRTVWRESSTEEVPLPQDPNVKLRRTVIDEVVVQTPPPQIASQSRPEPENR